MNRCHSELGSESDAFAACFVSNCDMVCAKAPSFCFTKTGTIFTKGLMCFCFVLSVIPNMFRNLVLGNKLDAETSSAWQGFCIQVQHDKARTGCKHSMTFFLGKYRKKWYLCYLKICLKCRQKTKAELSKFCNLTQIFKKRPKTRSLGFF